MDRRSVLEERLIDSERGDLKMTVQEAITSWKSLDRNVIGKNEQPLREIRTSALRLGGVFILHPRRRCNASDRGNVLTRYTRERQWEDGDAWARPLVLDVDEESSGSKQKLCAHSIFSMSAGVGRGSLKCEDDRSLLSQRLWSDISMSWRLNHTPTHNRPHTPDIPAKTSGTLRYLTSSYHTLVLISRWCALFFNVSARRPLEVQTQLGIYIFFFSFRERTCDEFWQIGVKGRGRARYLKHSSVRGVALQRRNLRLTLEKRGPLNESLVGRIHWTDFAS